MLIRKPDNNDIELFDLYRKQLISESPYTKYLQLDINQNTTAYFIKTNTYLAFVDNNIVGHISYHKGIKLNILSLGVLKNYQGNGIADQLMQAVYNDANKLNKNITLSVNVGNKRARAFYKRHGFQNTSICGDLEYIDSIYSNPNAQLTMEKKLNTQIATEEHWAKQEKIVLVNGKRRRYRVDVYAIQNNHILAVRMDNGLLETPGGGLDIDETPEAAGLRELMEEAGWIGRNPHLMSSDASWLYQGDVWPGSQWDEELQIAVMCNAVHFVPTKAYGSEGDESKFKLIQIDQLIHDTRRFIQKGSDNRRDIFIAKFRLHMLQKLGRPAFTHW